MAYLHVIRMPKIQDNIALAKAHFSGPLIVNDSYSQETAEAALVDPQISAVSFGRAFIANPDLPLRFAGNRPLAEFNPRLLYSPGPEGYSDYPIIRLSDEPMSR